MIERPAVSIIILNWNNARDTIYCLSSVEQLDYSNYEILVVDNGSTDGSVDKIRTTHPSTQIIELSENNGFARGNNEGIMHALNTGADYVLLLNNDTAVDPGMLTSLVDVAENNPEIAMLGPKIFCWDEQDTLFAAGSFISWNRGLIQHRGMFLPASNFSHLVDVEDVDFIIGCGVLVRSDFIRHVGSMKPGFFLNFEDVEWGIRAGRHGYKVVYVPWAKMMHKVSSTLGQGSPLNTYYMTRNGLQFFWRHSPSHLRWIATLSILLRTIRSLGAWTLRPRYWNASYRRRRNANLIGIRDFFLGKTGMLTSDGFSFISE